MKQTKLMIRFVAMLALLLVCFVLPASSHAASGSSNDNHTDTDDYCLRAHDVTIGLSEFSGKSRAELEGEIVSASTFAFLIRDTASPTGTFVPITSGYTIDFSNLTETASSSGYVVTVTLPAITLPSASTVQFRVFVADDLPHSHAVQYAFSSGTAVHTLPVGVTAQLPADESILSGTTLTPAAAFAPVRDGAGVWNFSGWSPASFTIVDSDVSFNGTWVWTALPVYTVSFEFVSGTSGRTLPKGVLDKLPMNTTGIDGDVFTAPDSFRGFHMIEGVWRFQGWDLGSQTVSGGNLVFTGEWRWHENKVVITPTPYATPAATPTATATIPATITPPPEETPEQPVAVLEQIPSDSQPPAANSIAGGAAKMAVATALTALVATQAFAIVSDFKVLKWYNTKKAARRVGT
jgi:hypothetical protein